jgi:hypothetical protein
LHDRQESWTRQLDRVTCSTRRRLNFWSEKELMFERGYRRRAWALIVLQQRVDNALNTCGSRASRRSSRSRMSEAYLERDRVRPRRRRRADVITGAQAKVER